MQSTSPLPGPEPGMPAIRTSGLGLKTKRGPVFDGVSFSVAPGRVAALLGPTGSGKTALLLVLGARMRPSAGTARVAGLDVVSDRRRVRRITGLGEIAGVTALDDSLTVLDLARERLVLMPGTTSSPRSLLSRLGLAELSKTQVRDLDAEERYLLGVALGLAGAPAVLLLDDVDHDLDPSQQERVWATLRDIAADDGPAILASCIDPRSAALAEVCVRLPNSREAAREIA